MPKSPSIANLRRQWRELHGAAPPQDLGRDLLARGISWRRQEKVHGGLPPATRCELDRLAGQLVRSGTLELERQRRLKPGTRLVREWHDRTYHVTVLEEGFVHEERHFASLSEIAREITGTRISGPRFFGLQPANRKAETVDA